MDRFFIIFTVRAAHLKRPGLDQDPRGGVDPALVHGRVGRCRGKVLAHRLLPAGASSATAEAHDEARAILEDIVADTPVPV